jgi:hypothetical protein
MLTLLSKNVSIFNGKNLIMGVCLADKVKLKLKLKIFTLEVLLLLVKLVFFKYQINHAYFTIQG